MKSDPLQVHEDDAVIDAMMKREGLLYVLRRVIWAQNKSIARHGDRRDIVAQNHACLVAEKLENFYKEMRS